VLLKSTMQLGFGVFLAGFYCLVFDGFIPKMGLPKTPAGFSGYLPRFSNLAT